LRKLLFSADSVVLVSHTNTGVTIVDDNTGKEMPESSIVMKGKLNEKIVTERVAINQKQRSELAEIIAISYQPKRVPMGRCFFPSHSILFFRQKRLSYIDVCFGCYRIQHSADAPLRDYEFDEERWEKLKQFFKSSGLTYELE